MIGQSGERERDISFHALLCISLPPTPGAAGQVGNDDGWTDVEMIIGKLLGMQTTGVPFAHIGPIYDDAQCK